MKISKKEQALLKSFHGKLKEILDIEIAAGNHVCEVWSGDMSEQSDAHLFVFLEKPFLFPIQADLFGIEYRDIDDPHYWKSEYYDKINKQVLACKFPK